MKNILLWMMSLYLIWTTGAIVLAREINGANPTQWSPATHWGLLLVNLSLVFSFLLKHTRNWKKFL